MKASEVLCVDKSPGVRFAAEQVVLSWSLTRPGFVCSDIAAWLEVPDADLPIDIDPVDLPRARLTWADYGEAVRLMTSHDLGKNHQAKRQCDDAIAFCLATVDLADDGRGGADTPHLGQSGMMAGGRAWVAEKTWTSQGSQER